ncbi:MAG: hypothetical protein RRY29_04000 [Desulfovibrionaceae bacterium]
MPLIADLLTRLPTTKEVRMSSNGHALWICWQEDLDPVIPQTLQNYGGMFIVADRNQSLWFFFSIDVFLALARLAVWAKFNEIDANIELFPAKLLLGVKREVNLELDTLLTHQEILPNQGLELWIHPKAREIDHNIPGITFTKKMAKQGMTNTQWADLVADVRMPYSSSQGWYALLRPLGNPLDRQFQEGWPEMFKALENLLQKNKLKFLLQDNFVMASVDNLRLLRTWLREMLAYCTTIKTENPAHYWPCVSVVIDRKGLNFNHELRTKVGLQWDNLMSDFPYMSYRNAYLLGEGFSIQDIRFSGNQTSMDSWCNVALDEEGFSSHSVPVIMAGHLITGQGNGCFYCGMRSHGSHECPSLTMPPSTGDVWWELAGQNLETINESFRTIEHVLTEKGLEGFQDLLASAGPVSLLLRAIFEINNATQLRMIPRYWLARGRDYDKILDDNSLQRDDSPAWDYLETLSKTSLENLSLFEKEIHTAITRNPRDPRLRTLLGFVGVNKNDPLRASTSFKEGGALTPAPLQQAWNEFLQARLAEVQGRYPEAVDQYAQILRVIPLWRDLEYRQLVCKVKMGFAEQALDKLTKLIQDDPNYFNRCLIDPELERGQLLILTHIHPLWVEAEKAAEEEKSTIVRLADELEHWFKEKHPMTTRMRQDMAELQHLSGIKNYVAFLAVTQKRPLLEKNITENIQKKVEELQERFKHYLSALQSIRDEASWFPFPKVLREFSREFNECAGIINWAFASNFKEVGTFQRALESTSQVNTLLRDLKKRLKFLRMVRDATLFLLTLSKSFFWLELGGLVLCFLGIPTIILYGDKISLGWLKQMLGSQQWEVQKVLVGIVSVLALGVAALRTTVVFEKRRDKLIEDARNQRESLQKIRLERIKRQRILEAEALIKGKKKDEENKRRLQSGKWDNT